MTARLARVYLDSSVLIGAVVEGANHAAASHDFCHQVVNDRTTVAISALSRYEVAHVASLLGNPAGRRTLPDSVVQEYELMNWSADESVRDRWMSTIGMSLESLLGNFNEFAEIPILPHLWHTAIQVMIEHDLQSYDALHVATARSVDVTDFATTDRQYARIDGLAVHLTRDS